MQYMQDKPTYKQLTIKANDILDRQGLHNRLQLVLALLIAVGLGLSIPMILDCLWLAGRIFGGSVAVWLDVVYQVLLYGSMVFVLLPLFSGVYRMAILMFQTHDTLSPETLMPTQVGAFEVLYAFTSPRAYGRALLAGLQFLLRWGGVIGLPLGFLALSELWLPTLAELTGAPVFLALGHILVALMLDLGWLCLSCVQHGYAYLLLSHPECSLAEIKGCYHAVKRPLRDAIFTAWQGIWRIFVGSLPVLVPLFLHTLPSLMLTWALQGQYMFGKTNDQEEN